MIGLDIEEGITHPNITKCEECGVDLEEVTIENHSFSPYFFKCVECPQCRKQYNLQPLSKEERTNLFKEMKEEEKASLELFQREREEYHNEGYSEVSCDSCNTKQWMLRTKPEGVCCECGNSFYNEYYDEQEHLKQPQEQRNSTTPKIKEETFYVECSSCGMNGIVKGDMDSFSTDCEECECSDSLRTYTLKNLIEKRNQLSRKISTLKKATLN